jgi:hypothetical protein
MILKVKTGMRERERERFKINDVCESKEFNLSAYLVDKKLAQCDLKNMDRAPLEN